MVGTNDYGVLEAIGDRKNHGSSGYDDQNLPRGRAKLSAITS